jgi:hypothetical protein
MTPLTRAKTHLDNWYETHDPRELADALREVIGELAGSATETAEADFRAMVARVMRESNAKLESIIADPTADPQPVEGEADSPHQVMTSAPSDEELSRWYNGGSGASGRHFDGFRACYLRGYEAASRSSAAKDARLAELSARVARAEAVCDVVHEVRDGGGTLPPELLEAFDSWLTAEGARIVEAFCKLRAAKTEEPTS